ncbi:unnamed protein product [Microthlaspi erraticum]|uniref:Uncharacterized protein n=1 Tax=Microthlaspi erraticum TaxID=1685480 RepID=A0A6D2I9U5_9BRAS|nr:unnamed protein product [Microthlaspi erraticum]
MGDSNSSSPTPRLDSPSFSCPTLSSPRSRRYNIDFRPPVYTLVGHEADLQEEEIELDRAEDRAESAEDRRIGLLQKFNKWQGKAIEKMQKSMDKMVTPHHSRRLPAQEPHRASSFEPREGEDNTQRRRKTSKARRSSSTTGLDRVQTEETQLDRADGRADQEEPQFEIRDLNTIPCLTRSLPGVDGTPMDSTSYQCSTKAKEATHISTMKKRRKRSRKLDRVSHKRQPQLHGVLLMAVSHLQTTT